MTPDSVGCVVVHHRSPETLPRTLASLVAAGVPPDHVVVVDNSEDDSLGPVRAHLGAVHVLEVPNEGYGAAVNAGCAWLDARELAGEAILVATHEVLLDGGTLVELLAGLDEPTVGAVGPTLVTSLDASGRIWSAGGVLSSPGCVPRHRAVAGPERFRTVAWLDGSLVLYRGSILDRFPFDPTYFLYLEEVDLHVRMGAEGWKVVVARDAPAVQSTQGMPTYWAVRNRLYFASKFDLGWRGRLGTLRVGAQLVRVAVRARDARRLRGVVRGLREGRALAREAAVRGP